MGYIYDEETEKNYWFLMAGGYFLPTFEWSQKCGHQAQYPGGGGGCSKGSDELPFLSKGKGKGVISNVARQGRGGVSAKAL